MGAPQFDNSYARLPERFYTRIAPVAVSAPALLALNAPLARQIGLDPGWLDSAEGLAMLAGNEMPGGADPIAQVYAGHQFGAWSPRLGDGRAHLLGELSGPDGAHWDIQLKGSGPTPYSRMGDGRAVLGPVMREYLVSEAMAALGVPTTRALAALRTGEQVYRETALPGAILTRIAPSHIRVGTFQYFASIGDREGLEALLAYAIARHYPQLASEDALGFLGAVMQAQAELVAHWMSLGFIHGVMNTDNTHIGGLTIDYGPCAFMDRYHPQTVYSSIDHTGRYSYAAQPQILLWNLAQLATALLPLIDPDRDAAIKKAEALLEGYGPAYGRAWSRLFFAKLGLPADITAEDGVALIQRLLEIMAQDEMDFTNSFRALSDDPEAPLGTGEAGRNWVRDWHAACDDSPDHAAMQHANPIYIPRNHLIEQAIIAGLSGDDAPFHRLHRVLNDPFTQQDGAELFTRPPQPQEEVTQTFCGT